VQYVSEVHEIEDVAELARMARLHAGSEMEDAVTTWIDKVRAEGKAEGRAEGEAHGRADAFLKLLTLKFGPPSASTIERVRRASLEDLDRFTERVLTADTMDDVLR
jgi:hypothetical protein